MDKRPPESRVAGVGRPGQRQYVNLGQALKPPGGATGAADTTFVKDCSKEYDSHVNLTRDRHKHSRAVYDPQVRAPEPVTSSQVYGWRSTEFDKSLSVNHNRKLCRETRFQQSIALGARHKSGYAGQGTL